METDRKVSLHLPLHPEIIRKHLSFIVTINKQVLMTLKADNNHLILVYMASTFRYKQLS